MFGKDKLYDGSMDKGKEYDGMKSTDNMYDTSINIIPWEKLEGSVGWYVGGVRNAI